MENIDQDKLGLTVNELQMIYRLISQKKKKKKKKNDKKKIMNILGEHQKKTRVTYRYWTFLVTT